MRLRDFFTLREDTHSVDPEWVRSVIKRYDPGVGGVLNKVGTRGLVIRGGNGTVWKLTDSAIELERAEALEGKQTQTIFPILRVVRLEEQHPEFGSDFDYVEGDLGLIQSELMHDVDAATLSAIESMRPPWQGSKATQQDTVDPAKKAELERWMHACRVECGRYGIDNPDLLDGEDNIKVDRAGALRLIDIG